MANSKISALPSASLPLAGSEELPIVQSGTTKKVQTNDLTVKNLRANASTGIFQVAGPGNGTTRTMTVPDADFDFNTQVRTSTLNQMAAPTADLSVNNYKITNLATPISANDAATKAYADALASGLLTKASCALATTANVAGTYIGSPTFTLTNTVNGAISVDGVTPTVGDRILLKNQTSGTQNGIYTVTTVGNAGTPYVLTRATDFDSSAEILTGDYTFIVGGATNAATGFILITPATITLDVTSLSFTQFSSSTNYVAGAGLTLTGLTFAVGAGTGIIVNADDVAIDTALVATTTNSLTMSNKTLTSPILVTPSYSGGTTGSILFVGGAGAAISQDNANFFYDSAKKYLGLSTASPSANLDINQVGLTTGSPTAFKITGGAHTTLTASTEATDFYLNLNRTVQFSTGPITTQRASYITAPTYSAVGVSTISTAATFAVSAPPTAGTNVTITRPYSIMSESGNVCFTMNSNAALVVDFLGANTAASARTVSFKSGLSANSVGSDFYFASTGVTRTAGNLFSILNNATAKLAVAFHGGTTITQSAVAAGNPSCLTITGGAHTSSTASTELSDVILNFGRTVQFATGPITNQRVIKISAPTYTAVGASVITTAATVAISGAPVASTNVTITNPLAFWIQSGRAQFDDSILINGATAIPAGGTTSTGLMVSSTANFGLFFGSGAPTLAAAKGSLYLRSDGSSTNNRGYINTDGATTWTAITTVA